MSIDGTAMTRSKSNILRAGLLAGAIMSLVLTCAAKAHAFSFTPLGIGTLPDGQIVEMYQIGFDPGESFPFHFHPGPLNLVVTQGTLTEDRGCGEPLLTHTTGDAFHESPGVVHMVTNNGSQTVLLQVSGVLPSCFTNFNDDIEVAGPDCTGNHAQREQVPSCSYLAKHCSIDPNLGGFTCTPEP